MEGCSYAVSEGFSKWFGHAMVVEGEPRRWQKAWNVLFPTIWRAFLKYASYLWRERKLRWAGHWNVCLRLFCFIQRWFVYVCVDYKSLPRHRGLWEKLESERKRERDLNEILFSGGTQLGNIRTHWAAHACERTHTHTHTDVYWSLETHMGTQCVYCTG